MPVRPHQHVERLGLSSGMFIAWFAPRARRSGTAAAVFGETDQSVHGLEIGRAVNEAAFLPGLRPEPGAGQQRLEVEGGFASGTTKRLADTAPSAGWDRPRLAGAPRREDGVSCASAAVVLTFVVSTFHYIENMGRQIRDRNTLSVCRSIFPVAWFPARPGRNHAGRITFRAERHERWPSLFRPAPNYQCLAAIIRLPSSASGMTSVAPAAFNLATSVSSATRTTAGHSHVP